MSFSRSYPIEYLHHLLGGQAVFGTDGGDIPFLEE